MGQPDADGILSISELTHRIRVSLEDAFTHVPLTLDHDTLVRVLDQVDIGVAGSRGTAVGTAIAVASKRLKALESKERLLILLTDGQSNAG